MFGIDTDEVILAYDNPVPEDVDYELNVIKLLADKGAITKDELRDFGGYEPMEEEDETIEPAESEEEEEEPAQEDETPNETENPENESQETE